jgi:hypothetical protein
MLHIHRYDNCETRDIDIRYIIEQGKQGIFDLPNSQREKEWIPQQNEKFILSILENKPIGTLILNKKGTKKYILDGQHRINAIEEFYKDNFGIRTKDNTYIYYDSKSLNSRNKSRNFKVIALDNEWKKIFLETKIFIIEYSNLSDNEMTDIIEAVNEGIKNDCDFIRDKTNDNEIRLNIIFNQISNIIFNYNFDKLKHNDREEIKKYIGYIGNIIDNFDNYHNNNDFKQLNIKHVSRYLIYLKHNDISYENIINFIKILFSTELMKHKDIIYLIDKYEINNYQLNVILYKTYEKYKEYDINFNENILHLRKCIEHILNNNKSKFKELLEQFDIKYMI